jgi:hypothetical protein
MDPRGIRRAMKGIALRYHSCMNNTVNTPDSSWVVSYELDAPDCVFAVTTKTGARYTFKSIPRHVVDGFIKAHSHGAYYNTHIRGKYQ